MFRPSIKKITKTKSIFYRFKKYLQYLLLLQSSDVKNYYAHYGKTTNECLSNYWNLSKNIK